MNTYLDMLVLMLLFTSLGQEAQSSSLYLPTMLNILSANILTGGVDYVSFVFQEDSISDGILNLIAG